MVRLSQIALLGSASLAAAYLGVIRPWSMHWGATAEEVERVLPGDSIAPDAGYRATRAITINAPPELVWPWLVQMGSGRAGWYSYDRIDNGGKPSARTIVEDLQDLSAGDFIPMITGTDVGCWVKELEPPLRMLLWDRKGDFSWEWILTPAGTASTRLVTRIRERYPPLCSRRMLYAIIAGTGDIVMIRKQLRGIRDRAQRLAGVRAGPADRVTSGR